jgi:hypothetical protein
MCVLSILQHGSELNTGMPFPHFTTALQNITTFTTLPHSWGISQHPLYFKTYISAARFAALVDEFHCVCELCYLRAAVALASVESHLCHQNQ